MGPAMRETLSSWLANNKGSDQPSYPCRLISAFVESTGEISIFKLVSVAEETGSSLALSETQNTCFPASRLNTYTRM